MMMSKAWLLYGVDLPKEAMMSEAVRGPGDESSCIGMSLWVYMAVNPSLMLAGWSVLQDQFCLSHSPLPEKERMFLSRFWYRRAVGRSGERALLCCLLLL